jgi:hypothetical protein
MKNLFILIGIISLVSSTAFAQQINSRNNDNDRETVQKTRIEYKDGSQQVRLKNYPAVLTITMRNGEITSISRKVRGKSVALQPTTQTAGGMNCPCGFHCWEDDILQQSICVCKSCGGGGQMDSFFDVFTE